MLTNNSIKESAFASPSATKKNTSWKKFQVKFLNVAVSFTDSLNILFYLI